MLRVFLLAVGVSDRLCQLVFQLFDPKRHLLQNLPVALVVGGHFKTGVVYMHPANRVLAFVLAMYPEFNSINCSGERFHKIFLVVNEILFVRSY